MKKKGRSPAQRKRDREDELFPAMDNGERRLWIRVILQAVEDSHSDQTVKIKDEHGQSVRDENGKVARFSVKQEALDFLTNKTKSLGYICRYLDLNLNAIKKLALGDFHVTQQLLTR